MTLGTQIYTQNTNLAYLLCILYKTVDFVHFSLNQSIGQSISECNEFGFSQFGLSSVQRQPSCGLHDSCVPLELIVQFVGPYLIRFIALPF